jgi:hypothetical protein
MFLTTALVVVALALQTPQDTTATVARDSSTVRVAADSVGVVAGVALAPQDTQPRRRPKAIEYSDWYARRLEVHRIGSYTMLPLFATQYVLGNQLIHGADPHSAIGNAHLLVASGIGVLFTVNTITGLWNLWDSRSDPAGRTRRMLHASIMLASDAGFLWTGAIGGDAKHSNSLARRHRNVALASMSVATIGAGMMWLWKD